MQLQPATAQTLALALHELVTNSAKYGALSTLSGRLSVAWEDERTFSTRRGKRPAARRFRKPISRGFGTRSVIASIESQLGGKADFDWRSEGLLCRLLVPLTRPATVSELGGTPNVAASNGALQRVSGSA